MSNTPAMKLPEGLHPVLNSGGRVSIVDAQDHTWVELMPRAKGDPEEWQLAVEQEVFAALDLTWEEE